MSRPPFIGSGSSQAGLPGDRPWEKPETWFLRGSGECDGCHRDPVDLFANDEEEGDFLFCKRCVLLSGGRVSR